MSQKQFDPQEKSNLISFLIKAKRHTYAGHGAETTPCRPSSHDLQFSEDDLLYYDTFLGGQFFSGQEALWKNNQPLWSMNYYGQVTGAPFSGDFLKEALFNVPAHAPFRGPEHYSQGDYTYNCKWTGTFEYFQGHEEIFYQNTKIYELHFHGGAIL